MATFQATRTVSSARVRRIRDSPSAMSRQCPSLLAGRSEGARRDADDQRRRDEERDRVDHVRRVRARRGHEDASDQRPEHGRHRVGRLEQALRAGKLVILDEVRQAGVDGRTEEAGGEAGDRGQRDDLAGARRERERAEDGEAHDVGRDHHAAAREAVDERADCEADRDRRQEVGDQQRRDPGARMRAVPDVDGQRDEREPGSEPRAERRVEEQPEPAHPPEEVDCLPRRRCMTPERTRARSRGG